MKFSSPGTASSRGKTQERLRRDRAATALLRTEFPRLGSVRLEFDFQDIGPFVPAAQVTVLHPAARAYFVFPCPYSHCDGEFDLTRVVNEMVHADRARCAGRMQCNGQRTPDSRGAGRCGLTLDYRVEAPTA
jgi:hypothetical protein